jgi:hypothetical protein
MGQKLSRIRFDAEVKSQGCIKNQLFKMEVAMIELRQKSRASWRRTTLSTCTCLAIICENTLSTCLTTISIRKMFHSILLSSFNIFVSCGKPTSNDFFLLLNVLNKKVNISIGCLPHTTCILKNVRNHLSIYYFSLILKRDHEG